MICNISTQPEHNLMFRRMDQGDPGEAIWRSMLKEYKGYKIIFDVPRTEWRLCFSEMEGYGISNVATHIADFTEAVIIAHLHQKYFAQAQDLRKNANDWAEVEVLCGILCDDFRTSCEREGLKVWPLESVLIHRPQ